MSHAEVRRARAVEAPSGTAPGIADVADVAPAGWDAVAVDGRGGNVMQGTCWAEHRRGQGLRPWFITLEGGHRVLVTTRRQRGVPGIVASARKGPIQADPSPARVAADAASVASLLQRHGALELFIDPEIDRAPEYAEAMDAAGFVVADEVQPSIHVMRLTLPGGVDREALFTSIARSTRQRIRAAERAGTVVRAEPDASRLQAFGELVLARAQDLHTGMRPELGYLAFLRRLIASGQARLYLADHDGELLGGLLVYLQGGVVSTAYWGDRAELRRAFPGTMHLVRWTAIREAHEQGARWIDLGGADLPGRREPPQPSDPNFGLYEHKASFGAVWTEREPARRIVLRPWAGRVAAAGRFVLARVRTLPPVSGRV